MCYSAMMEADYATYVRRFGAEISFSEFVQLYWQRETAQSAMRTPRGMDRAFAAAQTAEGRTIKEAVDRHAQAQILSLSQELQAQRDRLADAEAKLARKVTKAASESRRIASQKIARLKEQIDDLVEDTPRLSDARVYPRWFAPVLIWQNGKRTVVPMRYLCRPNGKPASVDDDFPATYNARRDSLGRYWRDLFGQTHGIVLVHRFFENVRLHEAEQRPLAPGEKEKNVVIEFRPSNGEPMLAACLWSRWVNPDKNKPDLLSFALITDEPPPEVRARGHDRCIIPIREKYLDAWLNPQSDLAMSQQILSDREPLCFEGRIVTD